MTPTPDILSDPEQEQAVLGIVLGNAFLPEALQADHFADPACLLVYDTIRKLAAAGRPVDLVATVGALREAGNLDRAGGALFVDALVETAPVSEHLGYHLARLETMRRRRLIRRAGLRLQDTASNPQLDESGKLDSRAAEIMADLAGADSSHAAALEATAWLQNPLPEPEQVFRGAFDLNTKTCVVGPSKARKSFFLLQAAVSLAAGLPAFLAWQIAKARPVLYANLEIPPAHFQRRLRRMVKALAAAPEALKGRLHILNGRGMAPDAVTALIVSEARRVRAEVLILDPIYKLIPGDESKQENVKSLLSIMDRICASTGAAMVYVHHGTKGEAGDRLMIDRAAGSGVLARDVDCLISLVHHIEDPLLVVEQVARSYPPVDAFTIRWDEEADRFQVEDGVAPAVRTSANRKRTGTVGKAISDADVLALVKTKPLTHSTIQEAMKGLGLPREKARATLDRLVEDGAVLVFKTKTFPTRTYYGTPAGIERLHREQVPA
jgi:hypothetical protein